MQDPRPTINGTSGPRRQFSSFAGADELDGERPARRQFSGAQVQLRDEVVEPMDQPSSRLRVRITSAYQRADFFGVRRWLLKST